MVDPVQDVPGWRDMPLTDREEVWRLLSLGKITTLL